MLPAFCIAALVRTHSQHYNIKTCVQQDGTIRVDNPKISSTYWVQDSTCTFLLDHHVGTIDAISFTRASTDVMPGTLKLANETVYHEDLSVHGKGEPFAILPMYKTMQELKNIATSRVTVHVPGKAMVSFGMAEDPRLVFYGVVMDAYEAREWTYGASIYLTFVHVGMFFLTLASALEFSRDVSNTWIFTITDSLSKMPLLGQLSECKPRYKQMRESYSAEGRYMANTLLSLSIWLDISAVMDVFIWTIWTWHRIHDAGSMLFLSVTAARCLFIVYLTYIIWEWPQKIGDWVPFNNKSLRPAVPLATGGLLTAHLGYWLHHGRDALHHASAYYVTVPVLLGLIFVMLPLLSLCISPLDQGPWYKWTVCIGQLALVTFVGILLNIGIGALAPMCVLFAFDRRVHTTESIDAGHTWIAAAGFLVLTVSVVLVDWLS